MLAMLIAGRWWLTGIAERTLQEKFESYGLRVRTESVKFSFSGLSFRGVRVGGGQHDDLVTAERVDVEVSPWSRRPKNVAIEQATVSLTASVVSEVLERRGQRPPSDSPPGVNAGSRPTVRCIRCGVRLLDKHGTLVELDDLDVALTDSKLRMQLGRAHLGSEPDEVIEMEGVEVSATLSGEGPQLERFLGDRATLGWRSAGGRAGIAQGRTIERLRNWRDALRSGVGINATSAKRSRRFSDGASIELRNVVVRDTSPSGEVTTLLDQLRMKAEAKESDVWAFSGQGALRSDASSKGTLRWDLRVVPSDLKLEGRVKLDEAPLSLFAPVLPPLPFQDLDDARVRADIEISGMGLQTASVKGEFAVRDLVFASPGLAETEVGPISFSARGQAVWTPALRELSAIEGEMSTGNASVLVSGALAWPVDGYRVDIEAELPRRRCRDVLAAVPSGVLGELADVQLSGDIQGKLTVRVDAESLDETKVDFDIVDKCQFQQLPALLELRRFERPFLHRVFEPDGTTFEFETGPGSAAWAPIGSISPFMTQSVIAHEDGRFLSHHGFAEPEIAHALAKNLKARAFRFGASTITMQLVKNLFLHRDKLLSRKVQEALIVWFIEQRWDKGRILELYLNVIEYGPEIYGIRNASLHYFGTTPFELTPAQSAFLASILPSPKRYHEQYERGGLTDSMKTRVARFLHHMHARGRIDEEALNFGLEELESFRFYDPAKPPSLPPPMRGTAQPLPFVRQGSEAEWWDSTGEDGSFGL